MPEPTIHTLIDAANEQGPDGVDGELEGLRSLLEASWSLMSPMQRIELTRTTVAQEILEQADPSLCWSRIDPLDETLSDLSPIEVTLDPATGRLGISGVPEEEMRRILELAQRSHDDLTMDAETKRKFAQRAPNREPDRSPEGLIAAWKINDLLRLLRDKVSNAASGEQEEEEDEDFRTAEEHIALVRRIRRRTFKNLGKEED